VLLGLISATSADHAYKKFKIDLDAKPEDRFREIGAYYKDAVNAAKDTYFGMIPSTVSTMYMALAPNME